jgi:hypothetical protein
VTAAYAGMIGNIKKTLTKNRIKIRLGKLRNLINGI